LGRRLINPRDRTQMSEIVGVVADIKHWGLDDKAEPYLYLPQAQTGDGFMTLVVRTEGDPLGMVAAVRREVQALDREQPIFDIKKMEQRVAEQGTPKRLVTWLLSVMAAVALVLAAIGIYGVIAYTVAQRTHEIGIRMALGAQARDIFRLVLRRGMLLAAAGVLLGLGGAIALMVTLSNALAKFLFTVSGLDPATYTGVALLLASVALLACLIPARRAMKVDPMVALRYE
jgi:putative ABC transport system permease protein